MHKLIFAGLALSAGLSAALIDPPQASALGNEAQWCRIARDAGGRDCSFYTFAQCAASTERLDGGGCYENPNYRGNSSFAATPARAKEPATAGGITTTPSDNPRLSRFKGNAQTD